jgi:glutamate 5-kinase
MEVEGKFSRGDVVTVCDQKGTILGCGIVNYDAEAIEAIIGIHSNKITEKLGYDYGAEVVHRNNLAVL